MYKTTRKLKHEALQALKGKWGVAVLMNLVSTLFVLPFTLLSDSESVMSILSIVSTLLTIVLNVGFYSFFLKICCGMKEQASFADLFYGFQTHPLKAILLYLLTVLYLLPGAFVYAILLVVFMITTFAGSGISADAFLYGDLSDMDFAALLSFVVIFLILTILYVIYATYVELTYGLVYYLLLDYPDLPVGQIWKRSAQLMKGNRWRKIKLELSFIPWAIIFSVIFCIGLFDIGILTIITSILFCIGIFWMSIYMTGATTEFYLDLVQKQAVHTQAGAVPNQSTDYTSSSTVDDTNLTHDCETTHSNMYENESGNYNGIDPDTFK